MASPARGSKARRFVDVMDRAIYLRSIPVAAELPPRVLHVIAQSLVEREFSARTVVQRGGEPVEALAILPEKLPIEVSDRPLDLVERVFALRCTSVFRKTNVNVLSVMLEQMPEVRAPAGTTLFEVGEPPTFTLFVVAGQIACTAPDGRRFVQGPGTAVGGVEALANRPRRFKAAADTDLVALRGSGDALVDLMEDNFDLGFDFVSMPAAGLKGMLARKAMAGRSPFGAKRDVSGLGSVPVGA